MMRVCTSEVMVNRSHHPKYMLELKTIKLYSTRIKKKYVFHLEYWRKTDKNGKGGGIKRDLSKHFSASGIQHKFKKVIKELGLNDRLSPHSCRRWFITYMLEKYNGNVPLVAQMVGHSSWEMVYRYNRERLPKQRTTIDINEIIGEI